MRIKSKTVVFLSVLLLAIIMGFASYESGDLSYYFAEYNKNIAWTSNFEIGYQFIENLAYSYGLSFNTFRMVLFLMGALLMRQFVNATTDDPHFVILLYSITYFVFLAVTFRFYIALTIVIFGFKFLKKRKLVPYIIICFVASLFHFTAIFAILFAIFVLPTSIREKMQSILRIMDIIGLLVVAVFVFVPSIWDSVSKFFLFIADRLSINTGTYLTRGYARIYVLYVILFVLNYILLIYSSKYLRLSNSIENKESCEMALIVAECTLILSPAFLLADSLVRMLFFSQFLNFVIYSIVITEVKSSGSIITLGKIKLSRASYIIICLLIAFGWYAVIYLRHALGYDFSAFLNNNMLLGG